MVEQDELLEMLPCSHCKNEKPPTQWSVSKTAAVRLWNRYMTNMKE